MDKRLLAVLIAVAAALGVASFILFLHPGAVGGERLEAPRTMLGSPAVKVISGKEAAEMANRIHWSHYVGVVKALIVRYADGSMIWVSVVKGGDAPRYADMMADRIMLYESSSIMPYEILEVVRMGACKVYLALDKRTDKIHAFWGIGDKVIWAELYRRGSPRNTEALKLLTRFYGCYS